MHDIGHEAVLTHTTARGLYTLGRYERHVIATSQAGTRAHTRPCALSSPITLTTTREACLDRWPNSDKYLDDKAEHDTLRSER